MQIIEMIYHSDSDLLTKLEREFGTNILIRTSSKKHLERILTFGTDRQGYLTGRPADFEDVVIGTTLAENRRGMRDPDYSTSLKKFPITTDPMLLIYDLSAAEHVKVVNGSIDEEHSYCFPGGIKAALKAIVVLRKIMKVVITGAPNTGKSTLINELCFWTGAKSHVEAPRIFMSTIDCSGHDPNETPVFITDRNHCCPICAPHEFFRGVCAVQRELETTDQVEPIVFFERGFQDYEEFLNRVTGKEVPAITGGARPYDFVFIMPVVASRQVARWGKTKEERTAEAEQINLRVSERYKASKSYDGLYWLQDAPLPDMVAQVKQLIGAK